jgi:hypothetical protein
MVPDGLNLPSLLRDEARPISLEVGHAEHLRGRILRDNAAIAVVRSIV